MSMSEFPVPEHPVNTSKPLLTHQRIEGEACCLWCGQPFESGTLPEPCAVRSALKEAGSA